MKGIRKRAAALGLSTALLLTLAGSPTVFATEAEEVVTENSTQAQKDALQDRLDALQQNSDQLAEQQEKIKADIAKANSLKDQQLALKASLDEQIQLTRSRITLQENKISVLEEAIALLDKSIAESEERIALLEQVIAEKESDITAKQQEYDDQFAGFLQRIRVLYMNGTRSDLERLLSASSFSEMLTRFESRKHIADHDRALLETLSAQKQELERTLTGVEEDKSELEGKRDELTQDKQTQEDTMDEIEATRDEIAAMKADLETQQAAADKLAKQYENEANSAKQKEAEILAQMQQYKAEMDTILRELAKISGGTEYIGGEFQWPLPGYSDLYSTFNESRSYYAGGKWHNDVHTGIDISGSAVYGKPIIAANSGTVYAASWSNVGYGNYVIIDHGGGISTLYGHCSSLAVSKGATVTKGSVIAYVGATGNVTGPHLHFEVRVNGNAVDPMQYFQKV